MFIRHDAARGGKHRDEELFPELSAEIVRRSRGRIRVHSPIPWAHDDPTDHHAIYEFLKTQMPLVRSQFAGRQLVIHVSPGTPAMHTIWVLMAESRMIAGPVIAVKSYREGEGRGETSVVPVEVGMDNFYQAFEQSRPMRVSAADEEVFLDVANLQSPVLKDLYGLAALYAKTRYPILILGERGTGKTTLASWIRYKSSFRDPERNANWPSIPCGQFSGDTMRAELFGYKKGAFTGATENKTGLLLEANKETVFFDEIGDMSKDLQRLLIRAIEEGQFQPLGGDVVRSDFRAIFATNLPLRELRHRLHPDFYDRIKGFQLQVPPLRELREDLPLIWKQVFDLELKRARTKPTPEQGKRLEEDRERLLKALERHPLPGNIRDLIQLAAYLILFALNDVKRDAVAFAVERLEVDASPVGAQSIARAFADGEKLDAFIPPGGRIDAKSLVNEFAKFLATEVRRIANQRKLSERELCGMSKRALFDWTKKI